MERKKALLLVGSPKGLKSTSHALGSHLLRRLDAGGMEVVTLAVISAFDSLEKMTHVFEAMDATDLIIFSFPLYVDQLPAPLVRVLELIAERREGLRAAGQIGGMKDQDIMAIVQCGFPETRQNQLACDIMRQFAREAGYAWAGALAMGMGGAIAERPLEKAGGMVRNVVKALDLAAGALVLGGSVPEQAVQLLGKPFIAKWLYLLMANYGMKKEAKKRGARSRVYDRPYS